MAAKVLLAEDNQPFAQVLREFLTDLRLEVVCATTGAEALEALQGSDFHLLVLDLKLPVLSGVDVLKKLREPSSRCSSLPVIIISGVYKGEKYAEAARRLGVVHYLEKPFTRLAFKQAVKEVLSPPAVPEPTSLRDLLVEIYNDGKQGLLTLANGAVVSFINGEPASFISRGLEFPSFLAAKGKLSLNDLQKFPAGDEPRLFFTRAGLLTFDELVAESRHFLVKMLTEALQSGMPAGFSTQPGVESPLTPISLPRFMYDSLKTCLSGTERNRFTAHFGSLYPARTALFFRRANLLTMRKEDINLLGMMNGRTSLHDILARAESPDDGAVFFHFLLDFGMIGFHPAAADEAAPDFPQKALFNRPLEDFDAGTDKAVGFDDLVDDLSDTIELVLGEEGMGAPLSSREIGFEQTVQRDHAFIKEKNYYEIFGISPSTFSFSGLKEAYFEKTRQYSPDKFMELSGATLDIAQEVLSHYANAYGTLSSVVAKERYDEMLNAGITTGLDGKQDDRLQARVQFQSGSVFLEMGEYQNAEKALQEAYTLEPDNAMHSAFLGWAIYRNPSNKTSRASQEKAWMLLSKSLQSGKSCEAFAFRGWMLMEEGRDGLAEGEFQKALKLNPKDRIARDGLKMLLERRESEKKGLFKRIFS